MCADRAADEVSADRAIDDVSSCLSAPSQYSAGEYSAGEYSAGEYSAGEYSAGEYSAGEYSAGEYSAGEYSAGEYSAGEYSAGEYSAGEYSAGLRSPDRLIDAEDLPLLHNTYPVKSQLATTQIKPKIKRNRGVWICEGDGLSVAGGDLQKVYRGWCDWIMARGQSLSL